MDSDSETSDREDRSGEGIKKYVPSTLTSVQYLEGTRESREKQVGKSKKRMVAKDIIQDLREEILDGPVEVHDSGGHGAGDAFKRRYMDKFKERTA